ncbi:MAG: alpha/beta hydrolase-fold protein [Planctomycetota bacterium]|nr:alpha/beta hydrolase-fold protein [Planctomycetota bacterium]
MLTAALPTRAIPAPNSVTKRFVLLGVILAPLAIVAGLLYIIAGAIQSGPAMQAKAVGAGAGATGMHDSKGRSVVTMIAEGLKDGAAPAIAVAPAAAPVPTAAPAPAQAPETAPGVAPAAEQPAGKKLAQPESLKQGFVLVVEDKSGRASPTSPIYVTGTFNNWNPADPAFKLQPQSDMRWRIIMKQPPEGNPIAFKFTRGSWEYEELNADMSVPGNRTLEPIDVSTLKGDEQPKIEMVVHRWGDQRPQYQDRKALDPDRALTITGDWRRLSIPGGAGPASRLMRDAIVWLPPGYFAPENASRRYPVLYLMDGQNVFEKLPTVPGEWGADETATELIAAGKVEPMIIVGVPNGASARMNEYLPIDALREVPPAGDQFADWLVSVVVPRVDRAFRTDPARNTIGGSSLGAIISLHAAGRHPSVFKAVLAESPSLTAGAMDERWRSWASGFKGWPARLYLGMGGKEHNDPAKADADLALVNAVTQLRDEAINAERAAGRDPGGVKLLVDPEATHTESAWAKRLPEALKFLFPPAKR